jgi:hypothetical protein
MNFFSRLFGAVPASERDGIRLAEADPWVVSPTRDVERFLRALPLLCPEGGVAYFEDTAEAHVAEFLKTQSIPAPIHVAVGTIWPRPDCYHVPLTTETMEALAAFLEARPAGFFCSHCHVYRDRTVLLGWYDSFMNVPLYVSRMLPVEVVEAFARALGSSVRPGPGD